MRKNGELRGAPRVRVIAANGDMLGVMPLADALRTAMKEGLDLVEVDPVADPSVCKLVDLRKYSYAAAKQRAEEKRRRAEKPPDDPDEPE